jgi:hypothetical protein
MRENRVEVKTTCPRDCYDGRGVEADLRAMGPKIDHDEGMLR